MKCAYIKDYDIYLGRAPLPIPEAEEILIKVEAIGLNRADILQVQGMYKNRENSSSESKLEIPGLEVSGFCMKTGKRVMALLKKGGQAEYVSAHRSMVFEIPEEIDFVTAASIPEAIVTIWLNLYKLGKLEAPSVEKFTRNQQSNGSVLIHGGSSGVGILAAQFTLASGYKVYTTASSTEKLNIFHAIYKNSQQETFVKQNLHLLSYRDDFHEAIRKEGGVDLILDILGGEYLEKNLKALKEYGKTVSIATMSAPTAEISVGRLLLKNLTLIGSTLKSKPIEQKIELFHGAMQNLLPLIKEKNVHVVIDSKFKLDDIKLAYDRIKSRKNIGKVVLTVR